MLIVQVKSGNVGTRAFRPGCMLVAGVGKLDERLSRTLRVINRAGKRIHLRFVLTLILTLSLSVPLTSISSFTAAATAACSTAPTAPAAAVWRWCAGGRDVDGDGLYVRGQ